MRVFLIVMVMALCGWPSCCLATNISFLHGDAFFPTSFDEKQLQKFVQAKSPTAYYSVAKNTGLIGEAGRGEGGGVR